MTSTHAFHSLFLKDLSLPVRLGWPAEERAVPQEVRISLELRFPSPPPGTVSDDLEDTICYAELSESLRTLATSQEFKLLERLGAELFKAAKKEVRGRALLALEVKKVAPPLEGLLGGAIFRVGEFQ
jgi:dihydroneopterin aldolase